jgi:formylglycine-generating enzyme required for sulfatase activity
VVVNYRAAGYRLPTEAEWEYACRSDTETPYFFEGSPKKYTSERFLNKIFGIDTTMIATFVNYAENSGGKTVEAFAKQPNPYGLLNTSGNVWEFCSDWYAESTYSTYSDGVIDPKGPETGAEHVIRGGSYKTDAIYVRSAERSHTQHVAWMVTDPQMPKSKWWYSDVKDVGFRVVCEYEGN